MTLAQLYAFLADVLSVEEIANLTGKDAITFGEFTKTQPSEDLTTAVANFLSENPDATDEATSEVTGAGIRLVRAVRKQLT